MNSPVTPRMQAALAALPPIAAKAVVAAEAAQRFRRLDEARRQLTVAAARAPSHPEVLHLQANLLALQGWYIEAVTALQQAMVQRRRDPPILNSLGLVLRRTGRLDAAAQAFQHALGLDSKLPGFNAGPASRCAPAPATVTERIHVVDRALQGRPFVRACALAPDSRDCACNLGPARRHTEPCSIHCARRSGWRHTLQMVRHVGRAQHRRARRVKAGGVARS